MTGHIYVHFPFCLYKCIYCDFNSYAFKSSEIPFEEYTQSLIQELVLRNQDYQQEGTNFLPLNSELSSIFFGGGTPSLMASQYLDQILIAISKYFKITSDTEITIEANPGTLDQEKIEDFYQLGINRISVGIQSLHDEFLKKFGRIHSSAEAKSILKLLDNSSFDNWNADLIYGFPNQSLTQWKADLHDIVGYKMPHLSVYNFMVEEGAPYYQLLAKGKISPPSYQNHFEMGEYAREFLAENSYGQYEVSNYCLSNQFSKHNLNYWKYGTYLGIGAGAVSNFRNFSHENFFVYRTNNYKKPHDYLQGVSRGKYYQKEEIEKKAAMREFIMMNLRLKEGIDSKRFFDYFGEEFADLYSGLIASLRNKQWMKPNQLALTKIGLNWLDDILIDFFDEV